MKTVRDGCICGSFKTCSLEVLPPYGALIIFRMITAEEAATAGRVRIGTKDILSSQSDAFAVIQKG